MPQYNSIIYTLFVHIESIELIAAAAKKYSYSGMIVLNHKNNKEIPSIDGFSIHGCVEISGNPSRIREDVRKYRGSNSILIATGGGENIDRAAVEAEGLDILVQPSEINNVLAKAAKDRSIAIGFNIGLLIKLRGDERIKELKGMRTNLRHARKYELPMVLINHVRSIYDLRAPREMMAVSALFGMTPEEALDAMSTTPINILARKKLNYIQEGIIIL